MFLKICSIFQVKINLTLIKEKLSSENLRWNIFKLMVIFVAFNEKFLLVHSSVVIDNTSYNRGQQDGQNP